MRTTAGVFEAAAASIALVDRATSELVYQAAWGAGAEEVVGMRLARRARDWRALWSSRAKGWRSPTAAATRASPRASRRRPATSPTRCSSRRSSASGEVIGALSVLDRRDGGSYGPPDLAKADLFADLAVAAIADRKVG